MRFYYNLSMGNKKGSIRFTPLKGDAQVRIYPHNERISAMRSIDVAKRHQFSSDINELSDMSFRLGD